MVHPHTGFIVAAYVVAALVMIGVIIAVVLDHRAQKRALARLEGRAGDKPR